VEMNRFAAKGMLACKLISGIADGNEMHEKTV
jgi:hypothetical protein